MTSNIISYAAAFSVLVVVVAMGLLAAACLSSNLAANKSRDAAALDAAVSHLFADITRAPGGHIVCVAADARWLLVPLVLRRAVRPRILA